MESIKLKIILLGSSSVGKTSLIRRFIFDEYDRSILPTISSSYLSKKFQRDQYNVELQVWDTAGQERFSGLSKIFYRGAHACILVFDANNPRSLEELKQWKQNFTEIVYTEEKDNPEIFLVCNKVDLRKNAKSNKAEIDKLLDGNQDKYHEVSASKSIGVSELFEQVVDSAYKFYSKIIEEARKKEEDRMKLLESNVKKEEKDCCI